MFEIACLRSVPSRMNGEPVAAATQQLVYFVVADPIVLLVIQHRDEYVDVAQEILQPLIARQQDGVIPAGPPFGKLGSRARRSVDE